MSTKLSRHRSIAMGSHKKTSFIAIAPYVLLAFFSMSSNAIDIIPTPNDIRLRVEEQVGLFWLDEETVLYRSFRNSELELIERGTFSDLYGTPRVLRSYNIRTREFKDLAETGRSGLCYRDGKVLYDKPGNRWPPSYVFGVLGNEEPLDIVKGHLSFIRCNVPDISHLPVKWPSVVVPLLEEHGFIELRRENVGLQVPSNDPDLFLYPPGANIGVPIEDFRVTNAQNLQWNAPIYAPWKGAYFVYTIGVRDSLPNSAWWLYPDGKTERLDIPMGKWNEFSRTRASFEPTRCGLIIDNRVNRPRELIFLSQIGLTFKHPQRIPIERHWRLAVSPDGRKAAVVAGAERIPNTNPSVLHVVQLCDV